MDSSTILGGMTNLNLSAKSGGLDVVVKFPGVRLEFKDNPFLDEFSLMRHFSEEGLSPKPIATGFVTIPLRLPFLVYRFESGLVHSSPRELTPTRWQALLDSLDKIHHSSPPNLREFESASDLLLSLRSGLEEFGKDLGSAGLSELRSDFDSSSSRLLELISNLSWTKSAIHGDIRLSNIVFQDDRVVFLDWAHCCRASHLFDYAYFSVEPAREYTLPFDTPLALESRNIRLSMEALALVSALSWTIKRLYQVELELIEPSLLYSETPESMMDYAMSKQRKLDAILKSLSTMI